LELDGSLLQLIDLPEMNNFLSISDEKLSQLEIDSNDLFNNLSKDSFLIDLKEKISSVSSKEQYPIEHLIDFYQLLEKNFERIFSNHIKDNNIEIQLVFPLIDI